MLTSLLNCRFRNPPVFVTLPCVHLTNAILHLSKPNSWLFTPQPQTCPSGSSIPQWRATSLFQWLRPSLTWVILDCSLLRPISCSVLLSKHILSHNTSTSTNYVQATIISWQAYSNSLLSSLPASALTPHFCSLTTVNDPITFVLKTKPSHGFQLIQNSEALYDLDSCSFSDVISHYFLPPHLFFSSYTLKNNHSLLFLNTSHVFLPYGFYTCCSLGLEYSSARWSQLASSWPKGLCSNVTVSGSTLILP